jgi:hypothetical protein
MTYPTGSIAALLAEKGITLGTSENGHKELFREGVSLGWFNANTAVNRFLPEHRGA